MCGIAGYLGNGSELAAEALEGIARAQAAALAHRGPDGNGTFVDPDDQIALAHTRLAVVDLSAAGRQPMRSSCGRFVISYNGETYNANALRAELERAGRPFRGHSDTEVVVEACAEWGVEAALERFVGMFAFALWDTQDKALVLARDRLGIKPLYFASIGKGFAFASELKALRTVPGFQAAIDRDAVASFMRFAYVPTPRSVYAGVSKLRPGTWLRVSRDAAPSEARERTWWSFKDTASRGISDREDRPDAEVEAEFDALVRDAVTCRTLSDVPLGTFLSGGIDSALVTALLQECSTTPVRSFTIGFAESRFDEAPHAAAVARHLGTDHTEVIVSPSDALAVIPEIPVMFDEPFADSSQIPTYLVSAMTRRHVTVALSGDGGDELFAGYNRYLVARRMASVLDRTPLALRRAFAACASAVPVSTWDALSRVVPDRYRPAYPGDKAHKLAGAIVHDSDGFYRRLVSQWDDPDRAVRDGCEIRTPLDDPEFGRCFPDLLDRMQVLDTLMYLPDDILTKIDRASMAVSLEVRVPLLDHRIVEAAWRLPGSFRIRHSESKWLLRRLLERRVPRSLFERPKMGFAIPVDEWLRGPLREWAGDLLSREALDREGLLREGPVRSMLEAHQSGRVNASAPLWNALVLQSWSAAQR